MDRLDVYPQPVKDVINYARRMFGGTTGNEKIFAFTPIQSSGTEYGIGIAILGEAGYVANAFSSIGFDDYGKASDFCDQLHGALGYSKETAQVIVIDTMQRSTFKREQESDTITVKLDSEQLEHAIEALDDLARGDTDVRDILQDAKDELDERLGSSTAFAR
jgi:hypothetical protein